MLSASKKIKFLSIVLGSLLAASTSVFAQSSLDWELDNSAVKKATAGQFSTDSDKVKSSDIFDLQRSFLSVGYLGNMSTPNGNGPESAKLSRGAVQGAFGVVLPNNMYLGFIGKYNFSDSDNSSFDTNGVNNKPFGNGEYTINSQLNMRLAFRINEMAALHYGLSFGPDGGSLFTAHKYVDKVNKNDFMMYSQNGYWKHEIAASVKFGEHKFTLPVTVTFNSHNKKTIGKINDKKVDLVEYMGTDYISLGLNPEITLGIVSGPLTGITIGSTLEFGLNNNYGKNGTDQAGTKYEGKQGKDRFDGDIYASFPMEWSLSEDKVKLAMEPKVSLGVSVRNTGNDSQKIGNNPTVGHVKYDSYVAFKPYAELPIGTMWKPVEWYELRLGTAMVISADYTWNTTTPLKEGSDKELDEKNKTTSYSFKTYSGIAAFFGMGFIVGEDFNIDLYAEATKLNLLNLDFGGQLTYRF